MSNQDTLLSDEELIQNFKTIHLGETDDGTTFTIADDEVAVKKLLDLINTQKRLSYKQGFSEGQDSMLYNGQIELITVEEAEKQKRLYAESVIGEDDEPRNTIEHSRRNFLRAEQRARIK